MSNKTSGFKGFDSNFQCRNFQFQPNKEYSHDGEVKTCESGFHFCENPFDVWNYYPPTSRFASVEGGGTIVKDGDKTACSNLHVGVELSLNEFIGAGVRLILDKVNFTNAPATNTGYQSAATNTGYQSAATNTGDRSAATNTGNYSAATNTGDRSAATNTGDCSAATNTGNYSAATNTGNYSAATNTGDRSAATVEGQDSIAIVTGYQGKAKGALGCWLVLTERDENYEIKSVKSYKVNGKSIKPDTFYTIKNGKIVKAD